MKEFAQLWNQAFLGALIHPPKGDFWIGMVLGAVLVPAWNPAATTRSFWGGLVTYLVLFAIFLKILRLVLLYWLKARHHG